MNDASIIIPTYNREQTVIRAIDSCLDGNNLNIEVIVVDDGSTDNTQQAIIDKYPHWQHSTDSHGFKLTHANQAIRYIKQANNGAPSARNNGLNQATGKYIKFLDSDDFLIAGAIESEFTTAESLDSQALLTGWINLNLDEHGNTLSEQDVEAPDLSNGIDDMLDGKGPCASAGFYLRERVGHLRWDEQITKAQDWMWAWSVCLDGVNFSRLAIPSSNYVHYTSDDRITQQGNSALRSTQARLTILGKVQEILDASGQMTPSRASKLAHYYYKDARMVCEQDRQQWTILHKQIIALDPAFKPLESQSLMRLLIRVFGLKNAVIYFDHIKKILKPLKTRR